MRKPRPELYFVNTLLSIDKIKRNIKDFSYKQFVNDEKTFGFITRELQEIGESVRKLLKTYNLQAKGEEDIEWRKIADFRNVVVHKYFGVEPDIIFTVASEEIPALEKTVFKLLKQYPDKAYLLQAIELTKPIYAKMNRHESMAYLESVEDLLKQKLI